MKIGIFQDVQSNFPAIKKAVSFFKTQDCDCIYHVGDLIAIGPQPKEVMDFALSIDNMKFIMGNHDYWYGFGLPDPQKSTLSDEEREHQIWVRKQIGEQHRNTVRQWKFVEKLILGKGRTISFLIMVMTLRPIGLRHISKSPIRIT